MRRIDEPMYAAIKTFEYVAGDYVAAVEKNKAGAWRRAVEEEEAMSREYMRWIGTIYPWGTSYRNRQRHCKRMGWRVERVSVVLRAESDASPAASDQPSE